MASLFERIEGASANGSLGPIRNRGGRGSSAPYNREARLGQSKADADAVWKHDRYTGPGKTLGSRLTDGSATPKVDASGAVLALRQAIGVDSRKVAGANLTIKGASVSNTVQIENLASGTTAADVEAIFKRCGTILSAYIHGPKNADEVTVRLKFKDIEDAQRAVEEFNGKSADGNVLSVSVIGGSGASLGGRLGGTPLNGSVDVLMNDSSETGGGSKMRSDELLDDPRAQILTVPPGIDPAEYGQRKSWKGRGGGRGRPGRGLARRIQRSDSTMAID